MMQRLRATPWLIPTTNNPRHPKNGDTPRSREMSLAHRSFTIRSLLAERRVISSASAAFLASVTRLRIVFISPGRITSRMPKPTISRPNAVARSRISLPE